MEIQSLVASAEHLLGWLLSKDALQRKTSEGFSGQQAEAVIIYIIMFKLQLFCIGNGQ